MNDYKMAKKKRNVRMPYSVLTVSARKYLRLSQSARLSTKFGISWFETANMWLTPGGET